VGLGRGVGYSSNKSSFLALFFCRFGSDSPPTYFLFVL